MARIIKVAEDEDNVPDNVIPRKPHGIVQDVDMVGGVLTIDAREGVNVRCTLNAILTDIIITNSQEGWKGEIEFSQPDPAFAVNAPTPTHKVLNGDLADIANITALTGRGIVGWTDIAGGEPRLFVSNVD